MITTRVVIVILLIIVLQVAMAAAVCWLGQVIGGWSFGVLMASAWQVLVAVDVLLIGAMALRGAWTVLMRELAKAIL